MDFLRTLLPKKSTILHVLHSLIEIIMTRRHLFGFFTGLLLLLLAACAPEHQGESSRVLVSTDWLAEHLDEPALVLLHVGTEEVYDSIHIPGARLVDPWEFTITTDSLRNEVPDMAILDSLLTTVGIGADSRILLYYEDEDLVSRTARVFVTLDYLGLGRRTSVLNGGLTAWTEEERIITDEKPKATYGILQLEGNEDVIARAFDLDRYRTDPGYVIGDTRSFEEFFGELDSTDHSPSGGHIDGAVHMPYESILSESQPHMFKDDRTLREAFAEQGIDKEQTVIFYCGSGIRASVNYLVSVHLGFKPMLYDGSYEEWEKLELPVIQPVFDDRSID